MKRLIYVRTEGEEVIHVCPWCRHRSFSLNPGMGIWHCWSCDRSGRNSALESLDVKITPAQRRAFARGKVIVQNTSSVVATQAMVEELFYDDCVELPDLDTPLARAATYYLKKVRGLLWRDLALVRPHVALSGPYRGRVVIPIFPVESDPSALPSLMTAGFFTARVIPDGVLRRFGMDPVMIYGTSDPLRYTTPKKIHWGPKSRWLFNAHLAKEYDRVYVCEGVFDALSVGHNAVAVLGKFARQQKPIFRKMSESGVRWLTVLLDPDGQREGDALALELSKFWPGRVDSAMLHGAKDPGEATARQIRDAGNSAVSARTMSGKVELLLRRKRLR